MSIVSPAVLLAIVVLAIIFFISGLLLLLLVRLIKKRQSFSSVSQSNRRHHLETVGSHAFQRQLHQLFQLHDSGLDQSLIESLPLFCYKDIMGLKEPFDCAVCLCEFSDKDKLRLLPLCSHAFHINCIDTWLLSNSTCPLCRGTIIASGFPMDQTFSSLDDPREQMNGLCCDRENEFSYGQKSRRIQENLGNTRVFSVRLGKFKSLNEVEKIGHGEISGCSLDARRCYSMGSVQYVFGDSDLQVSWSNFNAYGDDKKLVEVGFNIENSVPNTDVDGRMGGRTRAESVSVSKIWLWSKKGKLPSASDANVGATSLKTSMSIPVGIHFV